MNQHRHRVWLACRPGLEALERRRVPAQFGVPWHDVKHLSISFAPDGTEVADQRSDLFKSLDAREPTAVWQREILQAFQTWGIQAHVNVSLKADGGEPLGTPGPDQNDPRFGDIRIAARAMSPEVLSISVPHDPFLSGTWSGDVLLNSAVAFDRGGADLLAVMLHEAGHVLGLDHSDDPNSVMSETLKNTRDGLAPSDIAAIQALYGPRPADPYEGPNGNDSLQTATPFPTPSGFDGTTPLLIYADVSTARDLDFYAFKAPAGYVGPATVRLQTSGVSLLAPRLTVYDASGNVVADIASVTDTGDTVQVKLPRLDPGATYFIEARGATGGVFGTGEYALAVSLDARTTVGPDGIDTLARQSYSYLSPDDISAIFRDPVNALFHNDRHTNDTFSTAEPLSAVAVYGSEAPDRITASLGDPVDVDVYRIETPEASAYSGGPGSYPRPLVMTVTGRATEVNGIMPRVAVFDEDRNPVPALVLAHGDGTYTVQVAEAEPGRDYFIRVSADPTSGKAVGNYELDVGYGHEDAAPTSFVSSTTGGTIAQRSYELVVNQSQLFDFLLNVVAVAAPPGSGVRMTVTDGSGRVVAARAAGVGDSEGGDPVLVLPGIYQVSFTAEAPGGSSPPVLAFRLYGASLSDPIGPELDDPTLRTVSNPSTVDPNASGFPAVGSAGDPYSWLAVTLSAPRSQTGLPTTSAFQDGSGPGGGAILTNGTTFLNAPGPMILTPPSAGLNRGIGNNPPARLSAFTRPPQSPPFLSGAVSALTIATSVLNDPDTEVGPEVGVHVGSRRVAGGGLVPQSPPTEPAPPPGVTQPAGRKPAPPSPDPKVLGEGRSADAPGSRPAPPAGPEEAKGVSSLAPAVLVLGVFTAAWGSGGRPLVTNVVGNPPSRRTTAGPEGDSSG